MHRLVPIPHRYHILQIAFVFLLATLPVSAQEELYTSRDLTPPGGFNSPEGPAVDTF
jgi:hypothetical protein